MKQDGRDEKGRWKPGFCPNPNGAPRKENSLNNLLRERLEDIDPDQERSNKDIIADALVTLAKAGNLAAIERVWDRVEGKPHQSMDVTSNVKFPEVVGLYPIGNIEASTAEDMATEE